MTGLVFAWIGGQISVWRQDIFYLLDRFFLSGSGSELNQYLIYLSPHAEDCFYLLLLHHQDAKCLGVRHQSSTVFDRIDKLGTDSSTYYIKPHFSLLGDYVNLRTRLEVIGRGILGIKQDFYAIILPVRTKIASLQQGQAVQVVFG